MNINNENMRNLHREFCQLLKEKGISQAEVVRRTGIPAPRLSFFVSGKRGLGGEAALRILNFIKEHGI